MCIGDKRKLTIPPEFGYGAKGMPPVIPGGATLVFVTELMGIQGVEKEEEGETKVEEGEGAGKEEL